MSPCTLPSPVARIPRAQIEAARPLVARLGPRHPVVRGLGLHEGISPERRLPVTALDVLWDALVEHQGPAAPLSVATEVRASSYGLLTYLLGCAPSGRHALRGLGRRYPQLLSEGTHYEIDIDRRHVEIAVSLRGGPRTPAATLFAAASVVGFLASEVQGAPRPIGTYLELAPPAPRHADTFTRFFGGPVTYGTRPARLVYERAAVERPLHGSDPALTELLEEAVVRRRPAERPTAEAVREILLAQGPSARASQAEISTHLGCSARALRRRLASEGIGFQAVVDQVRQRWAEAWLAQPETRVAALARTLGYADTAAFRRAFRRWTGMSPATWAALARRDPNVATPIDPVRCDPNVAVPIDPARRSAARLRRGLDPDDGPRILHGEFGDGRLGAT